VLPVFLIQQPVSGMLRGEGEVEGMRIMTEKIIKTDAEWRAQLTPEQYAVLRQHATERPFTGALLQQKGAGVYSCAACGQALFSAVTKFESGSGWPSFWDVIEQGKVNLILDTSHGMRRVEVTCSRCDSHLGHVFDDGPRETTGQRYCINSVALKFEPESS
jgi:peptide-methionine (R)-S-oxide reductase